jgi:hypothetical protein
MVPLDPAYKAGLAGHVSVEEKERETKLPFLTESAEVS